MHAHSAGVDGCAADAASASNPPCNTTTATTTAMPIRPSLLGCISRVLVLNGSRLYADHLRRSVQGVLTAAATFVACSVADADAAIADGAMDLLVTSIVARDGDVLDWLPAWTAQDGGVKRAFVVTNHNEPVVLHRLVHLAVAGVFDQAMEGDEEFADAVNHVAAGGTYWSKNFADDLAAREKLIESLTPVERMILGVIGDGCDDLTAARRLGLSTNTIRSVRGALHRKLHIQQKGELIAFAAELGFVLRLRDGILRPGLAALIAEHQASRRLRGRKVSIPPDAVAV